MSRERNYIDFRRVSVIFLWLTLLIWNSNLMGHVPTKNPWQIGLSASYTLETYNLTSWAYGLHVAKQYSGINRKLKLVPEFSYLHAYAKDAKPINEFNLLVGPRIFTDNQVSFDAKIGFHFLYKHYIWTENLKDVISVFNVQLNYMSKKKDRDFIQYSIFSNFAFANRKITNFIGLKTQLNI